MNRVHRWNVTTMVTMILALAVDPAGGALFECRSKSGKVVYQDQPCAKGRAERRLTAGPAGSGDASMGEEIVRFILLSKAACDLGSPGFRERSQPAFKRWRAARMNVVRRVESSKEYRRSLAEVKADAPSSGSAGAGDEGLCENLLSRLQGESRPVDPRFTSPESAWRSFVDATGRADRTGAITCLTGPALSEHEGRIRSLPPDELRKVAAYSQIAFGDDLGPYRTAVATDADGRKHTVTFGRTANGEWKISSI